MRAHVWETVLEADAANDLMRLHEHHVELIAAFRTGKLSIAGRALEAHIARLDRLDRTVSAKRDPFAGAESVFVGRVRGGSVYNEFPQTCLLEGTRRWLPGTDPAKAEAELRALFGALAAETGTTIAVEFRSMGPAFRLEATDPLVRSFQDAHEATAGHRLPLGGKPFVDDANAFWAKAGIPAITHGPRAGGAHTTDEWVDVDDLVRVAKIYALTAVDYCSPPTRSASLEFP